MKKFIAISHWDYSKNITCIVSDADTRKEFEHDLKGNGFIAWMVLSEKKPASTRRRTSSSAWI